jgi:hypothetical protein
MLFEMSLEQLDGVVNTSTLEMTATGFFAARPSRAIHAANPLKCRLPFPQFPLGTPFPNGSFRWRGRLSRG